VAFDHEMPGVMLQAYCKKELIHWIPGKAMYYPQMLAQWELFLGGRLPDGCNLEVLLRKAEAVAEGKTEEEKIRIEKDKEYEEMDKLRLLSRDHEPRETRMEEERAFMDRMALSEGPLIEEFLPSSSNPNEQQVMTDKTGHDAVLRPRCSPSSNTESPKSPKSPTSRAERRKLEFEAMGLTPEGRPIVVALPVSLVTRDQRDPPAFSAGEAGPMAVGSVQERMQAERRIMDEMVLSQNHHKRHAPGEEAFSEPVEDEGGVEALRIGGMTIPFLYSVSGSPGIDRSN